MLRKRGFLCECAVWLFVMYLLAFFFNLSCWVVYDFSSYKVEMLHNAKSFIVLYKTSFKFEECF